MNCNDFERQLELAVESRGPTANEQLALREHLQSCSSKHCRQLWDTHEQLTRGVGEWRHSLPKVDLVDRVVDLLQNVDEGRADPDSQLTPVYRMVQEPLPGRPSSRSATDSKSWGSLAAVAAALLLLVTIFSLNTPTSTDIAATDGGADRSAAMEIVATEPPAVDVTPSIGFTEQRSRRERYASIPLSATEFVTDAVVLVVPADLSDPDEEPSQAEQWAKRLGAQLEPIGKELNNAFESLMQSVPKSPTST